MKLIALVCLLSILSTQIHATTDFSSIATLEEEIKAGKCIIETGYEIKDLIKLVVDLVGEDYPGAIFDVYNLVKRVFKMLDNCKTLFCFGPTFEKCNRHHSQGCEKNGLVVYPKCASGYTNWGCCVCANVCPSGFTDNGLYCLKPKAYGRGAGYPLWQGGRCKSRNSQGCEKWGLIWYPKCKPGYHNVGCCICSPNCPSGWNDIGISCQKPNTYGRGVGYPVSFGFQCIKEHAREKLKASSCQDQLTSLKSLNNIVNNQYQKLQQNSNANQKGFADNIEKLGEDLTMFASDCMEETKA